MKTTAILLISTVLFLLAACGGGSTNATFTSSSDSGFVTVSIGDDDINDFDQAIFEISQLVLIGDDKQIVLLDEPRTIDFLALETVNEVLAETEVPVGAYSKLRLAVDAIDLIKLDINGAVAETVSVRLVANGKVDIVPRGEFTVESDSTLVLDIDVDLAKSIKLTKTGNGRYIFRPVIFADIVGEENNGRIVRVEGEFEFIDVEGLRQSDRFSICAAELMSDDDEVAESQTCRLVLTDDDTGFFLAGEDLTLLAVDDIQNGDNVVVYGLLQPAAFDSEEDNYYGTPVSALVVAKGAFNRLEGASASSFDETAQVFDVALASGQGIVGDLEISTYLPLSDGALLADSVGNRLPSAAIASGVEVEVEGLLSLGQPNTFKAFAAIIDTSASQVTITGMATDLDLVARTLTLNDGVTTYCVEINESTAIQLIDASDESASIDSVPLEALINAEIEVTGELDSETGCLMASTIILDISSIL